MSAKTNWVIITGASSGLGKALASEFAAGSFNLFLTGRNEVVLEQVAAECRQKYNVETRIFPVDLSELNGIDSLIQSLLRTELEYSVLVNNAGFAVKGEFAALDVECELQLMNVQLSAMLKLTRAVLPKMLERRAGRILNVASVYSFAPVPLQAVYSACKAFMMSFSASLSNELKGTGVTVTTIYPGITQTAFRSRAGIAEKNKAAGMSAQAVAQIAYNATLKGKPEVVPGFANRLFVFVARHLPPSLFARVISLINNQRGVNKSSENLS